LSGPLIHRAVSTARAVRAVVARPPYVVPGHFYSPLTTHRDVDRALGWTDAPGVDLAEDGQLALAARLAPVLAQTSGGPRYIAANSMYGPADAAVYRGMLRELHPARVIEVGSGYSTAVALDEADSEAGLAQLAVTCVEPYPDRLLRLLKRADGDRVRLIRQPVQEVDLAVYGELGPRDILFIDSTHVVKPGSDVVWLLLHVLPRLAPGVVVHIHDVFWPFDYPAQWLREGRDWTEAYLVHAFLVGNTAWEIMFFSSWFWRHHPGLVPVALAAEEPGSLWLRKVG
jgi:predicted O-methyltransferase YrrM